MHFADYASKASTLIATVPRGTSYPKSVAATFDLAISQAVLQCAATEVLMAFLSHCGPQRIPMLIVDGAIDDESERLQALAALAEVALLKHDPFDDGIKAVTMHRLVQAVARERSKAKGLSQAVAGRMVARLVATFPDDGFENWQSWSLCARLTPHLFFWKVEGLDKTSDLAEWADLLNRAGRYFHGRAAYSQAASLLQEALASRERAFGKDHLLTATSLNNLALLLRDMADVAGARPLLERALGIIERLLGSQRDERVSSLMATTANNLALLRRDQGDLPGARVLFERALAIEEEIHGSEHRDTITTVNNLAALLHAEGDLEKAQTLCERALAFYEKVLGSEHPYTSFSLNNLASMLYERGDFESARPLYERALAIAEKTLGREHPDTALKLSNLARLLRDIGQADQAELLFRRAIGIGEATLGVGHPQIQRYASHYARLRAR
jgi:tetratricopeptide (TPR) repeat protein